MIETATVLAPSPALRITRDLRRLARSVEIMSQRLLREHQLTVPQLQCLEHLASADGCTLKSLARSLHLTPSTVVGIVDRLSRQGLVQRERTGQGDRRQVHLHLSPGGAALLAATPSPVLNTLQEGLDTLPPEDRERIAQSLEQLAALLAGRLPEESA